MKKNIFRNSLVSFMLIVAFSSFFDLADKPVIYIIGDSTVKNGTGTGENGLWGWGDFLADYFDTSRIAVRNFARGGRSSRTFRSEGLWNDVLKLLNPGDFVLMQFGHNDGGPLNTKRARGTLKGTGNETDTVIMEATNRPEVVHTYGWYMKKYITDTREKGAIPVVLSPIPRNIWNDNGKVIRADKDYEKWAAEAAHEENACFINLNGIIADHYDEIGKDSVNNAFFIKDHTHTTKAGAIMNAASVVEGISMHQDCSLKDYLKVGKKVD